MSVKRKVAWGITGCGDKLAETLEVMKQIKRRYAGLVEVQVYVSKAGNQVLKYYRLGDELRASFERVYMEVDANTPFLAGWLQLGKFEFLLVAPASSNTVAKIAVGICDTMLSNAVIMGLKAYANVYVMPSDYREGKVHTKLPGGEDMELRIRKEDAENARKLAAMDHMTVFEKPEEIFGVFEKHFGSGKE